MIEIDDADDASSPQIAMDDAGNAIAVWVQYDGSANSIYANRYDVATGLWGGAELIEIDDTNNASSPQIAMDSTGNAIAVWYQSDGSYYSIYANRYDVATGLWGGAILIDNGAGSAQYPQIAMDSTGNAMAVWVQYDGSVNSIYANRYDVATGLWGGAILIDNGADAAYEPQIAMDGDGNAMAVWRQPDGGYHNIYANRYDAATDSWDTAILIENGDAGSAFTPQVAMDDVGNAMAVWRQIDGSYHNIYANRYDVATASWGTAILIESDAGSASSPQIAMGGDGNAMAVWYQSDGSYYSIYANRYDAATDSWDVAELVETNDTGSAFSPQIAMDGDGNAMAVWRQPDSSFNSIFANRYEATTGSWEVAELLETDNTGHAAAPQIAMDDDGNATAVWQQSDGSVTSIYANRYE